MKYIGEQDIEFDGGLYAEGQIVKEYRVIEDGKEPSMWIEIRNGVAWLFDHGPEGIRVESEKHADKLARPILEDFAADAGVKLKF